jgi:hypothetical protein
VLVILPLYVLVLCWNKNDYNNNNNNSNKKKMDSFFFLNMSLGKKNLDRWMNEWDWHAITTRNIDDRVWFIRRTQTIVASNKSIVFVCMCLLLSRSLHCWDACGVRLLFLIYGRKGMLMTATLDKKRTPHSYSRHHHQSCDKWSTRLR